MKFLIHVTNCRARSVLKNNKIQFPTIHVIQHCCLSVYELIMYVSNTRACDEHKISWESSILRVLYIFRSFAMHSLKMNMLISHCLLLFPFTFHTLFYCFYFIRYIFLLKKSFINYWLLNIM